MIEDAIEYLLFNIPNEVTQSSVKDF